MSTIRPNAPIAVSQDDAADQTIQTPPPEYPGPPQEEPIPQG